MAELPQEAKNIYNRALDIFAAAQRNNKVDRKFWEEYAGLMTLAIKKSESVPFPEAHRELGRALMVLGKNTDAERELNIALLQDPNAWDAQLYKVAIYSEKIRELPGAKDFVHVDTQRYSGDAAGSFAGNVIASVLGTLGKAAISGVQAANAVSTHNTFKAEVEKLITMCKNFCETNTDVDTYLSMAGTLIELGDEVRRMPLTGPPPNLYDAVVSLPTAKLDATGREQEISDIRNKAEGKSLLLKG